MGVKTAPPPQIFKNLSFTERYAIAVLMVIAAALLRYVLLSIMGATSPYITFYLAIVIAAAMAVSGRDYSLRSPGPASA